MSEKVTKIEINENLRITLDRYCWAIQRPKKNSKTGEVTWISQAWFPSLTQTVEACVELSLSEEDLIGLDEINQAWISYLGIIEAAIDMSDVENLAIREFDR